MKRSRLAAFLGVYVAAQAGMLAVAAFTIAPVGPLAWFATAIVAGLISALIILGLDMALSDASKGDDQ